MGQYPKLQMHIDGAWCTGSDGKFQDVVDPATEQVIGQLPHASKSDLDRALAAAQRGFEIWKSKTALERQDADACLSKPLSRGDLVDVLQRRWPFAAVG